MTLHPAGLDKQTTFRIDTPLAEAVKAFAEADQRSLGHAMRVLIAEALAHRAAQAAAKDAL